MALTNPWPSWGETGTLPSPGFAYAGGDQVNEKHLDALWYNTQQFAQDVINETLQRDGSVNVQDDTDLQFGADGDWGIKYDATGTKFAVTEIGVAERFALQEGGGVEFDGTTVWDGSALQSSALDSSSVTVTAGNALVNGGSVSLGGSITIDHQDTSTQGNFSAATGEAVTDINLDTYGHVTSISSTAVGKSTADVQSDAVVYGEGFAPDFT